MLQFLLLTLAGAGMAAMVSGGDDETSAETDTPNSEEEDGAVADDIVLEEPEVEEELGDVGENPIVVEDEVVGDTGATLMFDEETNVLSIEVGEDEAGTLAVIRTELDSIPGDGCCSSATDYALHVYLIPEGTDFPPSALEVLEDNQELAERYFEYESRIYSDVDDFLANGNIYVDVEDYLDNIGAEKIGELDLGGISSDSGDGEGPVTGFDTTINDVTIDANRDYAAYLLDLDESQILEGSERPEVADSGTVTTTDEDGETTTETFFFTPDIHGTDGDDTITVQSTYSDLNIFAGDGDDEIIVGDSYTGNADGGAGDDTFALGQGSTFSEFTSGAGSDTFILEPRDDGNRDYFRITDFEHGTDQIILELGGDFDKNWTFEFIPINNGMGTELHVTFPEVSDQNDIAILFLDTANLTADDVSIVRAA